jgi:radical SAM superfamily enzyme YgiQ (UPF0313 family)
MKQAGCNIISLGIESANDQTLRFLKKGFSFRQVQDTIRLIRSEGIDIHGWFILGIPVESRADMQNTINFAIKEDFDYALFSILTPMPQSELQEIAINNSWFHKETSEYSKFLHQNKPVLQHPQLSAEEILRMTRWAQVSFFLKYSRLKKIIKKIFENPNVYYNLIFRHLVRATIR